MKDWPIFLALVGLAILLLSYGIVDPPSGIYAAASCLNADLDAAKDWLSTREKIIEGFNADEGFE